MDVNVSAITPEKVKIRLKESSQLGIFFPTHGFIAPWIVVKFALRLPRIKFCDAFCVATQASLKFGKVIVPGLSGIATFLIAFILFLKGYRVKGVESINMPSNWLALHSGLKAENVTAIINRAKPRVKTFWDKICSDKKNWITGTNFYELLFGLPLLPIAIMYMIAGRFFLGKIFFANSKCDLCGICAEHCPVNAIKMKKRPYWTYKCESCMRCIAYCPHQAIEVNHPWAFFFGFIAMVSANTFLLKWISKFFPTLNIGNLLSDIVWLIGYFLVTFISYYLLYGLTKIPMINKILTYTTFTHIYRRYREPDTKVTDMSRQKNEE